MKPDKSGTPHRERPGPRRRNMTPEKRARLAKNIETAYQAAVGAGDDKTAQIRARERRQNEREAAEEAAAMIGP